MKKTPIVLILCALISLSACGDKEETHSENKTAQAPISHEENSGYFEDIISDVNDAFGEKIGEEHTIVATAPASDKDKNYYGIVSVYYDYNHAITHQKNRVGDFYMSIPSNVVALKGTVVVDHISFRIDDTTYDGNEENAFLSLYNALIGEKDVLFSLDKGRYIFTIHGEGFANIVNSLPSLETNSEIGFDGEAPEQIEPEISLNSQWAPKHFSVTIDQFVDAFNTTYPSMKIEKNAFGTHSIYGGGMEFIIQFFDGKDQIKNNSGDRYFNRLWIDTYDKVSYSAEQTELYLATMLIGYNAASILDDQFSQDDYSKGAVMTENGYTAAINGVVYTYKTQKRFETSKYPDRLYRFSCER